MAQELTITTSLTFAKGGVDSITRKREGYKADVAGSKYVTYVQNIGTSAEALDVGEVATCGMCHLRNLDGTNFIKVRIGASGADVVKLKPGETACFRLAGNNPYAIADTAACNLEVTIVED